MLTDPEHIVVRWSWSGHAKVAPRVTGLVHTDPTLVVVRAGSRRDLRTWLDGPLPRSRDASTAPPR